MFSPEDCFSHLTSLSTGATQTLDKLAPSYHIPENKPFANAQSTITPPDLKCKKCFIQFSTSSDLNRHMNAVHSEQSQRETLEGNNVEQLTTSNHNDSATVNIPLFNTSKVNKRSKTTLEKQRIQCKFCSSSFKRKDNYQCHSRTAHCKEVKIDKKGNHTFTDITAVLEDITCSYCKISFSRKSNLKRHIERQHIDYDNESDIDAEVGTKVLETINKEKLMCKMCDSEFWEFQVYKRHCRTVHRKLIEIDTKGQHKLSDFEEPMVPYCSPSDNTFSSNYSVDRHMDALHSADAVPNEQNKDSHITASIKNDFSNVNTLLVKSCEVENYSKTTPEQSFQGKFKDKHTGNHAIHTITDVAVLQEETTCSYCKKYFNCKKDLESHIESEHAGNNIETDIDADAGSGVLETINKEKLMCEMCDSAFRELRVYQRHCRTVHSKIVNVDKNGQHTFHDFEESMRHYCSLCDQTFISGYSLDRHTRRSSAHKKAFKRTQAGASNVDSDDEEDVLPYCIPCGTTFSTMKNLKRHLDSQTHQQTVRLSNNNKVDISRLRCPKCNRIYSKNKELREHLRCQHREYYMKNKLELFPKEDNTYGTIPTCEICEKEFDKYYNLKKHTLTVHNRSFDMKCLHCNKAFTSITRLEKHIEYHIRQTHDQQKRAESIKCAICNKVSWSSAKHDEHISVIHYGTAVCTCSVCKMSIRKPGFKRHMKRHINNSKLRCSVCKMPFRNNLALMKHKENHIDKENPFKCNVCFKTFTNQRKLKLHMYVHNASYIRLHCKICDRKFYDQRILDQHMKKHAKRDPIVCSYCGKLFMRRTNLQQHIKQKHLNKKPYICEVCGKEFELEYTLKRHALVHTREKAFQCPICYQKFSQQASVKRHMVVHSGENPYKCKHCDKRYSQTTYLQVHIKNHHGGF